MEGFQDIEHFVESLYAAIKKKIPTKVSQLTNDVGYKTTDTNTTYKLSKSGSTVTLTGSDGSTTSVTDSNTTYSSLKNPYSFTVQNNGTTVTSYDGSAAKTVNLTNATASSNGLMSASDKSKLDGIDPSAITTNAANIKKNADAISAEVTRAKKAEEANTQLTNDLKTGLTSGTVRVAKATVADSASSLGKVFTYQTWIPDNDSRRKYLLMYDITDWISAKSNAPTRGFDGYFISRRGSGFVSNNCTGTLSIVASYNGMSGSTPIKSDDSQSLRLRTTSEMYKPVILHNTSTNKYYLAIETYGSVRDLVLFGIFQGAFVGKWVQNVGQSFTPGTLPDGYELYSEGYVSIPYERAIADKNGKDITEYLVAAAYADGAFTFTRGNGSKTVLTIPDTVSNTVNSHIANNNNPHKVTASQVGALPLSGGSLTGKLTVPSIETGSADANYFQTKKMRGEGDADSYYHAIDFGYAGHNQVDFYEFGGKYVFHRHTQAAKNSGDTVIGEINGHGFVGNVNGHVINADVPADAKFTDTTYPVFAGATASENGTTGLVPEPTIEDAGKYLCGDGTWKTVSGGTGASDSPVEVPITKTTNVIRGEIVVYRIGHLLQIYANDLLIKRSTGNAFVTVCSISNVDVDADGFTLGSNIAIWTAFDVSDNPFVVSGSGLVLAQPNHIDPNSFDVMLIGVSGSSQYGVYFSLTVPLLDKKEEKE